LFNHTVNDGVAHSKKVRVSRDLWPWPWPWAHPGCTLTWSPSCESLVAIRPFAWEKKRFAQKVTDRRTDRRRTPRHCISLFLEWAKNARSTRAIVCNPDSSVHDTNVCPVEWDRDSARGSNYARPKHVIDVDPTYHQRFPEFLGCGCSSDCALFHCKMLQNFSPVILTPTQMSCWFAFLSALASMDDFMIICLTVYELSRWQTDKHTNRHYWKQYHPRCGSGNHCSGSGSLSELHVVVKWVFSVYRVGFFVHTFCCCVVL